MDDQTKIEPEQKKLYTQTVKLRSTRINGEYLQKCIDKGGNIWFSLFDKNGALVKGQDRYFGLGFRIEPDANKQDVWWVHLIDGQARPMYRPKKDEALEKPVVATKKTIE